MSRDDRRNVAVIPDEHLRGIGLIVTYFTSLESSVEIAIWALLGIDSTKGAVITSEMSFKNMLALFSSLFMLKTSDNTALEEMKELLKRATQVEEKRNVIVHSLWGVRFWSGGRMTVARMKTTAKMTKGIKRQDEELTVEDLDKIADDIVAANRVWTDFLYKYLMPGSPVEPPYAGSSWGKQ